MAIGQCASTLQNIKRDLPILCACCLWHFVERVVHAWLFEFAENFFVLEEFLCSFASLFSSARNVLMTGAGNCEKRFNKSVSAHPWLASKLSATRSRASDRAPVSTRRPGVGPSGEAWPTGLNTVGCPTSAGVVLRRSSERLGRSEALPLLRSPLTFGLACGTKLRAGLGTHANVFGRALGKSGTGDCALAKSRTGAPLGNCGAIELDAKPGGALKPVFVRF